MDPFRHSLQFAGDIDRELWAMIDEELSSRRAFRRTRFVVVSFLVAGFAAAVALLTWRVSWQTGVGAFVAAFLVGPVLGLGVDALLRRPARREASRAVEATDLRDSSPADA